MGKIRIFPQTKYGLSSKLLANRQQEQVMSTGFTNTIDNSIVIPAEQAPLGYENVNTLQAAYTDDFSTPEGRDEIRRALISTSDKAYEAESLSYLPNISIDDDMRERDDLENDIEKLNYDEMADTSLIQSSVFENVKYRARLAEETLGYDIASKQELGLNRN